MDLFLVIAQGIGLAAACGVRPFLPVLVAGGLAGADRGVDFDGTRYAFLEGPAFLAAVAVAFLVLVALERRRGAPAVDASPLTAAAGGLGIGLGALEFGGSLAGEGHPAWLGLAGGLVCAGLAQAATRNLFSRASARLDAQARSALVVYLEGTALVLAATAVLVPPLSLVGIVVLVAMLVRGRRRDERKYAGLRVLR
jgi:hypothetical protein